MEYCNGKNVTDRERVKTGVWEDETSAHRRNAGFRVEYLIGILSTDVVVRTDDPVQGRLAVHGGDLALCQTHMYEGAERHTHSRLNTKEMGTLPHSVVWVGDHRALHACIISAVASPRSFRTSANLISRWLG